MTTEALIEALRCGTPGSHSTWHHLATLLERGALRITEGSGVACVEGTRVLLPSGRGRVEEVRQAWWQAVVRREPKCAALPPSPLAALGVLSCANDPGREQLSRLLSEAPQLTDPPHEPTAARGWLRHQLFHVLSNRHRSETPPPQAALLDPPSVPPPRSDPGGDSERVEQLRQQLNNGARVGIVGAAASGKSTLAAAAAHGTATPIVHADAHTWPGNGFRYVQHTDHRRTVLSGPYITHHHALLTSVRSIDGPLIVEGTTVGWDPALAAELDLLVFVHLDAAARLTRKRLRDAGHRTLALELDFAEKQFLELQDVCIPLGEAADWVWHRTADLAPAPT